MRDYLIGYLLDALEPAEHEMVTAELSRDPQLQRELELISRSLQPLSCDREHFEPPMGLADRTCEFVTERITVSIAPQHESAPSGRWSLADVAVAAGLFIAATMLFFPALNQSRFAARVTGCQNNLRQLGMALTNYSQQHNGYFPHVPSEGRMAFVGSISPRLIDYGFLKAHNALICPASSMAEQRNEFRVPACAELERAEGANLEALRARVGGSYGYNIGYVANGVYQPTKLRGRSRFALVADAPNLAMAPPYASLNHDGKGQNVLFEDMHVQYLTTGKAHGGNDDIFANDDGDMDLGLHAEDAVIAPSPVVPRMIRILILRRANP